MKRGPKTALSTQVEQMSTRELLGAILLLIALITLGVLIGLLIGQPIDGEEVGIGWIVQLGVILI